MNQRISPIVDMILQITCEIFDLAIGSAKRRTVVFDRENSMFLQFLVDGKAIAAIAVSPVKNSVPRCIHLYPTVSGLAVSGPIRSGVLPHGPKVPKVSVSCAVNAETVRNARRQLLRPSGWPR